MSFPRRRESGRSRSGAFGFSRLPPPARGIPGSVPWRCSVASGRSPSRAPLRPFPGPGRGRNFSRFGPLPENYEDLADQLDRTGIDGIADPIESACAGFPVVNQHAHLDQFVALEREVDLLQDPGRHPGVSDHHDRMEAVGSRSQRAALGRSERLHLNECLMLNVLNGAQRVRLSANLTLNIEQ